MSTATASTTDPAVQASLAFLEDLLCDYGPRDFAVRFWEGTTWEAEQPARYALVLQHPGALRRMFWPPNHVALAEAYVYNDFDVQGDVHAFFRLVHYLVGRRPGWLDRLRLARRLLFGLPSVDRPRSGRQAARLRGAQHSRERDRQAISYHYDVSNDFYALWLDRRMVYSCAYFHGPDDDIDKAQEQKLDHVCRKLRLRPGERLLDVGCGWGGLVMHAAQNYGVEALGITLSRKQVEFARERIRREGLAPRCRVEYGDYRDIDEPGGFDKLVSVGVMEHVGRAMLPTYFQQAWHLLRPRGVFLNHHITLRAGEHVPRGATFAQRYVFPDGELRPISATLEVAEDVGFEVRDLENLREHYRLTLRHWVRRLEARADEARRATDDVTYRVWRLYLAGAADGFERGRFNLCQSLLAKPDRGDSGLPLTRADWYPGEQRAVS